MSAKRFIALAFSSALVLTTTVCADQLYLRLSGPPRYNSGVHGTFSTTIYNENNHPRSGYWREKPSYRTEPSDRSYSGAILGGIVGGVVGHQIGQGGGRDVATAAGAMIGAITGDNIDNRDRRQFKPVEEEYYCCCSCQQ